MRVPWGAATRETMQILKDLVQWCTDQGFIIDSRLSIKQGQNGFGVFTNPDGEIPEDTTDSKWFYYLKSLPKTVELPILWEFTASRPEQERDSANDVDRLSALEWLTGTEVQRILLDKGEPILEQLKTYYREIAEPLLKQKLPNHNFNFEGFLRAYCLVSSRAFIVDRYHGLSMVPVADAFNHVQENHVHIEADFEVCLECGSVDQCPHDDDDDDDDEAPDLVALDDEGQKKDDNATPPTSYYEMVSVTDIPAVREVFNTYGETLSDAQLLSRYGFVLEANENDRITWNYKEISETFGIDVEKQFEEYIVDISIKEQALEIVDYMPTLQNELESSPVVCGTTRSEQSHGTCLYIDSDGKISDMLFLVLLITASHKLRKPYDWCEDTRIQLKEAVGFMSVYHGLAFDDEDERNRGFTLEFLEPLDKRHTRAWKELVEMLIHLCTLRKRGLGKRGFDEGKIGDLMESIAHSQPLTKNALSVVLSEMTMLNACLSQWEGIRQAMTLV
ncbi:hypothetical protein CC1G_04467 [Coprinopsis cinerea okayama7|uniref:SET domain-containing protein n=1 Tax=Coprinopsis cinerea (strain Okayama-7 / 130 / ATCC MYA-4618 / FGSC 9003) TaxID=240176 RepID=A8N589_COPC7|nr:hypothetical protein CC1G_04467 [Coprinopsis cinerea okayama7\|eukprot:XP_001830034.2 hypothetical protein CC1G_04467 [Coprinopsis cinerea okayama7\